MGSSTEDTCKMSSRSRWRRLWNDHQCLVRWASKMIALIVFVDWGEWSDCFPACGRHRRKLRYRLCLGDFGCIGGTQMTKQCSSVDCNRMSEAGYGFDAQNITKAERIAGYYKPSKTAIFITILGILLPFQLLAIVIITCCLVRWDMKRHVDKNKA